MDETAKKRYPEGFFYWIRKKESQRIYAEFVRRALQMKRSGREIYSAKTIIEIIRWHTDLRDKDVTFKLSNNWTSGLARLAMAEYEELDGFFRIQ